MVAVWIASEYVYFLKYQPYKLVLA